MSVNPAKLLSGSNFGAETVAHRIAAAGIKNLIVERCILSRRGATTANDADCRATLALLQGKTTEPPETEGTKVLVGDCGWFRFD